MNLLARIWRERFGVSRSRSGCLLALCGAAALGLPALIRPALAAPRDRAALHRQLRQTEAAHTAHLDAARAAAQRAHIAAQTAQRLAAARTEAQVHLRQTETALEQARARLRTLRAARTAIAARMARHAADLSALLPVMLRLSAYPTATLLAVSLQRPDPGQPDPDRAGGTLEGALVLRGLSATLEQRAAALRAEQTALVSADAAIRLAEPGLRAAQAAQQEAAAALARQWHDADLTQHQETARAEAAAREAAMAASRAHSLRAAIAALEAAAERFARMARGKPAAGPGLAAQGGILPVAGQVVRGFGMPTSAGPAQGMSIAAASAALVVAPCSGRAVFAAPFRSYGKMVILDCGPHIHLVLAGLKQLEVRPGQSVRAGSPVGRMPDWTPHQSGPRPALYMELRRGDRAVNPAPYLAARG